MPPSRALIVKQGGAGIEGAAQERLGLQVAEGLFQALDFDRDFRRHAGVFFGHLHHGGEVAQARIASSKGLTSDFGPLSRPTTSWAFSRLFQKSPWPIWASMAAICVSSLRSQRESLSRRIRFWMLSARSISSRSIVASWRNACETENYTPTRQFGKGESDSTMKRQFQVDADLESSEKPHKLLTRRHESTTNSHFRLAFRDFFSDN